MQLPSLASLAVPAVLILVSFLGYSSQYLFLYIEPQPLTRDELLKFNILLAALFICYARACTTDPGRLPAEADKGDSEEVNVDRRPRWCRKCNAAKWPRAHHCKTCGRCIPKMDHHCPWTVNCVSHTTYPHFIRFVFYAVAAMGYLLKLLYVRDAVIWRNRNLPMYLGPSVPQLVHLLLLNVANSLTFFALIILLVGSLWNLAVNQTTIETWEIERHEALLRRARHFGGYLDGPEGTRIKIVKQEFPYDIGIWKNIAQGMGSSNPLSWFWPLSRTPSVASGISFETNGFEDPSVSWPPPDPDRITRKFAGPEASPVFTVDESESNQARIEAFRQRQQKDLQRWQKGDGEATVRKRKTFHKRFDDDDNDTDEPAGDESGEEGWKNSEGERLKDFGVDEEVEFYDEEDLPLAKLIEKRRAAASR
ncbi:zf-DHHC-domain-containing protein [Rhizodiscina lignyota]|uniref:Palmitoyltransferase PFA4 n=1 Tax=Rhizodiscina lignyota TaxID=1504668 RepID=A0A9P4ID03_9PEZI|nr:zf-DHHC-domain-containing protein [Rhizodiscina lignyota]